MAGMVCTITEETIGTIKKVKAVFTADNPAGTAQATTTKAYTGKIEGLTTVPAAGGDAPSADWDVVIEDEDGVDVLMGAGMNRSNAAAAHVVSASLGCVALDKLTVKVSNAGAGKKGTVYIWIR